MDHMTLRPVGFEESLERRLPKTYSLDTLKSSFTQAALGPLSLFSSDALVPFLREIPTLATFQLSTLPLNLLTDALEADILKNIEKPVLLSELRDQSLTSLREAFPDTNASSLHPLPLFFDSEGLRLPLQFVSGPVLTLGERPTFAPAPSPRLEFLPKVDPVSSGPAPHLEARPTTPLIWDAFGVRHERGNGLRREKIGSSSFPQKKKKRSAYKAVLYS